MNMNGHEPQYAFCVDLDGTLIKTDLLYESVLALIARNPLFLLMLPVWLLRGKAVLKREIARRVALRADLLPYDARVLEALRTTEQRPRVLCTASDILLVKPIADHLGLFEQVIASDGTHNLAGHRKAAELVRRFGKENFDYLGNSHVDIAIWQTSRRCYLVNASPGLVRKASASIDAYVQWPPDGGASKFWLKALRLHQWVKNILVFAPLLAAHRLSELTALSHAVIAFLAFGLCASGVYLLNDMMDLEVDRAHPRKRKRPFAAGRLPLAYGFVAAPFLTIAGFALSLAASPQFTLVLLAYYLMTLGYSLRLKRIVMLDVAVLAALYTIRIVGGSVAIGSPLSFWILAFAMFVFLSLAMLKRYTELRSMLMAGKMSAAGRGYAVEDLPLIQSLGAAAGYLCVLVLALYINSPERMELYTRPKMLWLLCPVLLYWVSRIWVVAHRGHMHDDPIVFAATDRVSQVTMAVCACIVFSAI